MLNIKKKKFGTEHTEHLCQLTFLIMEKNCTYHHSNLSKRFSQCQNLYIFMHVTLRTYIMEGLTRNVINKPIIDMNDLVAPSRPLLKHPHPQKSQARFRYYLRR